MTGADVGRRGRWQAPGPDHPERLALPAHLRLAAAALFDDLPAALPGVVVDQAAHRLTQGGAALAPDGEVLVDAFRVRAAAGCPAAATPQPDEPFTWAPATAARSLGLRAVAHHQRGQTAGAGLPVEAAVDAVVAELIETGGPRTPGPWLADLPPPDRAVAVAQARRWAEQAVAWLPLRLVGQRELRFLDDDWWRSRARPARHRATAGGRSPRSAPAAPCAPPGPAPRPPGVRTGEPTGPGGVVTVSPEPDGGLVVHGRRDVTVEAGDRRVAVTLCGGTAAAAGQAEADALTALAGLLSDRRGRLVRVVRVHPASGEVAALDVSAALVERGVEVVLATAAALVRAEPPAIPGPGCTWCPRQAACAPGSAWLERPDRRSMGLPLLPRGLPVPAAAGC